MIHKQRKHNRLQGYDYSRDNLYFVTSCVQDRICCLGFIKDGIMYQNEWGNIVERQWYWLAEQYPYVVLHAFVVMPNHVHGIIEINRGENEMKIKSLSELMGAFKTTSSKQIHLLEQDNPASAVRTGRDPSVRDPSFQWQRSFHDHIIRTETAYERIANYIINNPSKWDEDKFYN